jgi:hypothetical protein
MKDKIFKIKDFENPKTIDENTLFDFAKEHLLNGTIDPIKLFFYFRMFSKASEMINKDAQLKDIIQNALEKYDGQNIFNKGVQVTFRKDYDYEGTGSAHYQVLQLKKAMIEEEIKAYKAFLEKVDCEMTSAKEEGVMLKPITFKRTRVISIVKPYKITNKELIKVA